MDAKPYLFFFKKKNRWTRNFAMSMSMKFSCHAVINQSLFSCLSSEGLFPWCDAVSNFALDMNTPPRLSTPRSFQQEVGFSAKWLCFPYFCSRRILLFWFPEVLPCLKRHSQHVEWWENRLVVLANKAKLPEITSAEITAYQQEKMERLLKNQ